MTDQPTPETPTCIHPDGYDGECPCTPSCGCCKVAPAAEPLRARIAEAIESEVYEYRERTMFWGETEGVTEEIARLATRGAMGVRDREMEQLRAKVAEIDHIINWHTTCASCARILDSSYRETMRAEQAEATLTRLRTRVQDVADEARGSVRDWLIDALADLDDPRTPAPDAGPTVAECVADDEAHWTAKYAGEGS